METLQNDFTTPEQSKRLLELGVPADSANCYYETFDSHDPNDFRLEVRQNPKELLNSLFNDYHRLIPCWSVGRLIKILHITYKQDWREYLYLCSTETCSKGLVNQIMVYLEKYYKDHDFSKLDE